MWSNHKVGLYILWFFSGISWFCINLNVLPSSYLKSFIVAIWLFNIKVLKRYLTNFHFNFLYKHKLKFYVVFELFNSWNPWTKDVHPAEVSILTAVYWTNITNKPNKQLKNKNNLFVLVCLISQFFKMQPFHVPLFDLFMRYVFLSFLSWIIYWHFINIIGMYLISNKG